MDNFVIIVNSNDHKSYINTKESLIFILKKIFSCDFNVKENTFVGTWNIECKDGYTPSYWIDWEESDSLDSYCKRFCDGFWEEFEEFIEIDNWLIYHVRGLDFEIHVRKLNSF